MKSRYFLGKSRLTKNFVQYPTCKDVNILAQFGYVSVVFPDVQKDSKLQVSILDCNTNTLLYNKDCTPVLAASIVANQPYSIKFCPYVGGYVLTAPSCPVTGQGCDA